MALPQGLLLASVLLLVSSGLHCSSSLPVCPTSCSCQRASLLNCSSAGLSSVPQHIQDSVTGLDLSNNLFSSVTLHRPHYKLRSLWLGNNTITHLSLCIERNLEGRHLRGRHRLRPWSRLGCVTWAPTLQLLSVERNQLEKLPEGLESIESLEVLQLSFNKISTLQPADFSPLQQLKELHLQHNLITSLHPQMFQDLVQLKVLDLSFNMMTSLHPHMYLTLRNIGTDVRLGGNRWQCDCSLRSLRRRMVYDSTRGLQAWNMVCVSPSILSGQDLLQLVEDDLNCFSAENSPELHQDVTVYSGSEILLSCSAQDSLWWTPNGHSPVSQPEDGLLIRDITEQETGLYVCVSEQHKPVSVFNLQISKIRGAKRNPRSLPRTGQKLIPQEAADRIGEHRNQTPTQSDLALAVCLSVFITFLLAFILGVLARPCIDVLWNSLITKTKSPATNNVSVEQRQYDNEAYSNADEEEEMQPYRERRVTFSTVDFKNDRNVQYYDTVANGDQESISDHVIIESEAECSSQISNPDTQNRDSNLSRGHSMEFEHIPDQEELEKISLSSHSDSSLSEKVFKEDKRIHGNHSTTMSSQLTEEYVQQQADFSTPRKVEVPHISIDGESEIHSEPDWPPHTNNKNTIDPDLQENEELFDFSDSVRSTSARSSGVFGSFNDGNVVAPTFNKQRRVDMSSSSSYISDDEPTQYTVNSDQESKLKIQSANPKRPTVRPDRSFASDSSDSDENTRVKVTPRPRTKHSVNLAIVGQSKSLDQGTPSLPAKYSSSSGNDSEAVISDVNVEYSKSHYPNERWPVVDLQHIPRIKRRLDIKATSPVSSSSDSEDETTDHMNKHVYQEVYMSRLPSVESQTKTLAPDTRWPAVDLQQVPRIKRRLDIKAPSPVSGSSSSSDSEDNTTGHRNKHEHLGIHISRPQTEGPHPETQWPAVDLLHVPHIKRRLDVKAPSPDLSSSSSSDSEDEMTSHINKHEYVNVHISRPLTEGPHSETQWPAVDLQHVPRLKRRLDVKASKPASDSSSSSDSEGETTDHITEHVYQEIHMSRHPSKESMTKSHDPDARWPAVNLQQVPRPKRRLDIKAPSPAPDSSSSSDSEDDTTGYIKKHEHLDVHISRPQKEGPHSETQWPAVDLQHVPHIKRRLDIKAPSPVSDSSSSSDSEDETHHINKHEHLDIHISRPLTEGYNLDTLWPTVDLQHVPRLKRRLDVKASKPASDSSSSSDSEDETNINKHVYQEIHMATHPSKKSLTKSHAPETRWPAVGLQHVPRPKRRLDIKAPPAPDSSSSSDSEDDTTGYIHKHEHLDVHISRPLTEGPHSETQWPAVDLQHVPRLKRRLDVKASKPASDSSSSSDSEDETNINKRVYQDIHMSRHPSKESMTKSHAPESRWPAVNLQHVPHLKRRLDIKAPSPAPDSSSSSDSEDETTGHVKKHEHLDVHISRPQTEGQNPETQWPAVDLLHVPHIKRRLDVKAPSPALSSSSSSDSEEEMTSHINKHEYVNVHISKPLTEGPRLETQWPAVDLQHVPRLKRRLDVKASKPASDSSSSSDSEGETTDHITEHVYQEIHMSRHPSKESMTKSHDPDARWPAVDLQHVPHLKRRLDIKAPSPAPDSSSSSDSEDEMTSHINKHEHLDIHNSRPQTEGPHSETQWPAVDLQHVPHIKRRLDVKASKPASDSSSSSDGEDGTADHINKHVYQEAHMSKLPCEESLTINHDPDARWPTVDFQYVPHLKRRLDIKAPSPASDSSSSEDEMTSHINKHEHQQVHVSRPPSEGYTLQTQWPAIPLQHVPRIKRRLDIKVLSPVPDSSSSSDSEDETRGYIDKREYQHVYISSPHTEENNHETQWPVADLSSVSQMKRRLDIKVKSSLRDPLLCDSSESHTPERRELHENRPLYSSESSDEQEEEIKDLRNPSLRAEPQPYSRWPEVSLSNIPYVKRHLDIKAPSPQQDKQDHQPQVGMGVSFTSKTSPGLSISQSPKTGDIKLEKYTLISEDSNDNPYTTPEIDSELQSRWATMNLGISRFRKRLEITHQPPNLPSSPPPDSPSYESGAGSNSSRTRRKRRDFGMQGTTDSFLNNPGEVSPTVKDQHYDFSGSLEAMPTTDEKPNPDTVFSFRVSGPAPLQQQHDSSPNNSNDDTVDHKLPDLSLGIPRIKRRLNIKAPSPEPSSSSSDSESENQVKVYTETESTKPSNMLGMTEDESLIAYKRLIIKASSPPTKSFSAGVRSQTVDYSKQRYTEAKEGEGFKGASHTPRRVQSLTFDGIVRRKLEQSRRHTDLDLPPELRWTGTGHHLSDLSISTPRNQKSAPTSPPAESELPLPDSLPVSKTDNREPDVTLVHKYPYLSANSVTPTSRDPLDKLDHSPSNTYETSRTMAEERRERRGLNALKAMSSERRKWDTETGSSLLDDHATQDGISFNYDRSEVHIIPLTGLAPASINEKRDLSYGIPNYRRHYVGALEPQQEAPPPIPATPPPTYDAAGLTWRSPQSSEKQNTSTLPSANLKSYYDYADPITEV